MTKATINTRQSNNTLHIPAREEFHRFTSNELSEGDFCTNHPSGYQINKVTSALSWTFSNEKKRNNNYQSQEGN